MSYRKQGEVYDAVFGFDLLPDDYGPSVETEAVQLRSRSEFTD